jgi:hypothetical protein
VNPKPSSPSISGTFFYASEMLTFRRERRRDELGDLFNVAYKAC